MPRVCPVEPGLPGQPIEGDQARYRERLTDAIRQRLPDLLGTAPVVSEPGGPVRVTVPYEPIPAFRRAPSASSLPPGGLGRGPGQPGDILARRPIGGTGGGPGNPSGGPVETVVIDVDPQDLQRWVFEQLRLPRLQPRSGGETETAAVRWTSQRDRGPLQRLDRMATVRAALRRRMIQGEDSPGILSQDLRYRSWRSRPRPQTQAVVGLLRDVSGSMDPDKLLLTLGVAWWLVGSLRQVYERVHLDWWVHHTAPIHVEEAAWWRHGAGGGTQAASAYTAIARAWQTAYPPRAWVWYLLHFTDGDDFSADAVAASVREYWLDAGLVGLVEMPGTPSGLSPASTLGRTFTALPDPPARSVTVRHPADTAPALRRLLEDRARPGGES